MAITEVEEFSQLLPLFRLAEAKALRPKVERALSGPAIPMDEDQNSSKGRNALFELVMAAKLKHAGLEPILGEHPDLACQWSASMRRPSPVKANVVASDQQA